jgi:hypothetical protein
MKELLLVPAVATLIVGVIAAIVSLVVSILAKDQKTSEFRQAWIDGLRNDVSQLLAHYDVALPLSKIVRSKNKADIEEYLLSHQKEWLEISMLSSRIKLRLNAKEHREFIKLLKDSNLALLSDEAFEARLHRISEEAQEILKAEWERVKRGEPAVVTLKRVSRAMIYLLISLLLALVAFILHGYWIGNPWW